jgi:4-hydroxy-tetrahydrodipicolinate synthase
VDLQKILGHINHLLRVGCDGVTLFGTCGEGASFSVAERKQVLEYVIKAGVSPNKLLVATYACALPDAVELSRHATAFGVFGVMFIPPFYFNNPTDEGVVQATCELIRRVADSRLRIVLYHIPSVTGVAFTEAAVAEIISRHPLNIIGLKDSSGDQQHSLRFIKRFPSIGIVIGNELQIPKLIPEGASGSVCGAGNISPNLVLRIIRSPQNVDKTDWEALNALGGLVWDAGKARASCPQHISSTFPPNVLLQCSFRFFRSAFPLVPLPRFFSCKFLFCFSLALFV